MPARDTIAAAVVGLLLLLGIAEAPLSKAWAQDSSIGSAIKATYLYKFPPYVEWPNGTARNAAQFTLCVVGADPFGSVLDRAVSGQQIDSRPIAVRRLPTFDPGAGCMIVFAAGSPAQLHDTLAAVRQSHALSVTDVEQDAPDKGIINFVIADNRVRFEIDDKAAAQAGFTISSKLLSLAINIRPRN